MNFYTPRFQTTLRPLSDCFQIIFKLSPGCAQPNWFKIVVRLLPDCLLSVFICLHTASRLFANANCLHCYPGYELDGINSSVLVPQRLNERSWQIYGEATFIPRAVSEAIHTHEKFMLSPIQDNVATPLADPQTIESRNATTRPQHIVAERRAQNQNGVQDKYAASFAKYRDFNVQTARDRIPKLVTWCLGIAFPFPMPRSGMSENHTLCLPGKAP